MKKLTLKKILETCVYLNVDREAVIVNPKTGDKTLIYPRRSPIEQRNIASIRQAIIDMVKQAKK
jgi:hypothetical protein